MDSVLAFGPGCFWNSWSGLLALSLLGTDYWTTDGLVSFPQSLALCSSLWEHLSSPASKPGSLSLLLCPFLWEPLTPHSASLIQLRGISGHAVSRGTRGQMSSLRLSVRDTPLGYHSCHRPGHSLHMPWLRPESSAQHPLHSVHTPASKADGAVENE